MIKAELVKLHEDINNLKMYIARRNIPITFDIPEVESCNEVLEIIEREVAKLKRYEKNI